MFVDVCILFVSECSCNRYGSVSVVTCAAMSGQCECKERFAGRDCALCEVSLRNDTLFTGFLFVYKKILL